MERGAVKSIGLLGGMSWESTALYYQVINREVARRLGGLHSARMHIASLDFEEIATRQKAHDWVGMADILSGAAKNLVASGAECILIGTNTMHRVAAEVEEAAGVPLIHIADATAYSIRERGLRTVGLLGTRFTMEQRFYTDHLGTHGIECLVPDVADRECVHRIIFDELCRGEIREASRAALMAIIERLTRRGAQGVILGCTELPLIIEQSHAEVPMFDTTTIHALAAVDFALDTRLDCPPRQPGSSSSLPVFLSHR